MCEKPFALNSAETEEMLAEACKRGLFIMEAMWTCLLPGIKKLKSLIEEGAIGKVVSMEACFGFEAPYDENSRLYKAELGGGALLDVGIYPLALATYLFGQPQSVSAEAELSKTGIDAAGSYVLEFANGVSAKLSSSINKMESNTAVIRGTEGSLRLPEDWWLMEKITLNGDSEIDCSYECDAYSFQVQDVCDSLLKGDLQSTEVPHEWTRNIMRLLDDIRAQIGVVYPMESVGV